MTTTVLETAMETRFVLSNVSWETYECLMQDYENSSAPRFTYDKGRLEIMSPLPDHERYKRSLEAAITIICLETGAHAEALGSTTYRREDLEQGFEPDSCYYFANENRVAHKATLDLRVDPPPDLVVEVDNTRASIDKLALFAAFGVPEVWRYDGERLEMRTLESGRYTEIAESRALPGVTAEALTRLLGERGDARLTDWLRAVREWALTLAEPELEP